MPELARGVCGETLTPFPVLVIGVEIVVVRRSIEPVARHAPELRTWMLAKAPRIDVTTAFDDRCAVARRCRRCASENVILQHGAS